MKDFRFSVVIPLYNKANHIHRALSSVLSQTVQDFEIIVIDDGSTDDGAEVVQSILDPRINLIRQDNAGVSAARNRGIDVAVAKFVAFLDADDAWGPLFLETIAALAEAFPSAGIYATAYALCELDGKRRIPHYRGIPTSSKEVLIPCYFEAVTLGEMPICASAVCIPKDVFRKEGMFPLGEKLGEDHDMWARIALKFPIAFSWTIGAVYFHDSNNRACVNSTPDEDIIYIRRLQRKLDNNEVPPSLVINVKRFVASQLIIIAAANVTAGNKSIAKRVLADRRTKLFWRKRLWWFFWTYMPYKVMISAWEIKRNFRQLLINKHALLP